MYSEAFTNILVIIEQGELEPKELHKKLREKAFTDEEKEILKQYCLDQVTALKKEYGYYSDLARAFIPQSKFLFVVPTDLNKYLSWRAHNRKEHKSVIVRESIREMMAADKEYQSALTLMSWS